MPNTMVQLTLLLTITLLFASVWTVYQIRRILQNSLLRTVWACLGSTLLLASFGCLMFLVTNDIEGANHHEDWLVASTLFVAALFMFGVCAVSLFTAKELARIDGLEKMAFFDPLTKLYTRGHIDSLLAIECERSQRETSQLSILLLDIDDFKLINDRFGHQAGDHVLKEFGGILQQTADRFNLIGRYGGEEFLIVSPHSSPVVAEARAERIRSVLSASQFVFEGNVIPVTVSIGVKTNFTFRETADDLVASADSAMYQAKRNGRNCVVVADALACTDFEIAMRDVAIP